MAYKGSFIGFTFGNRHSSQLGIFRTSNSNRYETILSPAMTDIVTGLDATDGQYYWGTTYSKKDIPISFAFYGLSEMQISQLKQIMNDKELHPLILDEEPHKIWTAKLTSTAIMKHVCLEHDGNRFYAGEGTFTFTAYYPFARSRYEYYEDYKKENIPEWLEESDFPSEDGKIIIYPAILTYDLPDGDSAKLITEEHFLSWAVDADLLTTSDLDLTGINSYVEVLAEYYEYGNRDEWIVTSLIPKRSEGYGTYTSGAYKLRNAGDIGMPFKIYFELEEGSNSFNIECADLKISLENIEPRDGDKYIVIDSHSNTVNGCDINYKKTKNLYNYTITKGGTFALPIGEIELKTNKEASLLEFNYLYM